MSDSPSALEFIGDVGQAVVLVGLVILPGFLGWLCAAVWIGLGNTLFPLMAPQTVPGHVAMLVTQIWLTVIGVAFFGAAVWDGTRTWRGRG